MAYRARIRMRSRYAASSQQRAGAAQAAGYFHGEIVAVSVPGRKRGETLEVSQDAHLRPDTSAEALLLAPGEQVRKLGADTARACLVSLASESSAMASASYRPPTS